MPKKTFQTQKNTDAPGLDYHWHLAETGPEVDKAELEFALMRALEGMGGWQSECLSSVSVLAARDG